MKRLVHNLDGYQRGHAWLAFPLAVVKKFKEDQAGPLAALIAYYTFFSLFPLLLALVTILGYVLHGDPAMQQRIVSSALAQFPLIGDQIRSNVGSLKGSSLALIVGLGGALWAGMGAVNATQHAMNAVWDVPIRDKPTFLKRRLRSLLMLAVIGGGLLATLAASTVASWADSIDVLGRLAAPAASVLVGIGVFMLAFRVLTEGDLGWSDVFPGAVAAAVAAVAFQLIGGFYLGHSLRAASRTYGTFAIVIGLLSWLYLQAHVILLAAEVNVVRARRLWPRSLIKDPDHLTGADRDALVRHAKVEQRISDQDVRTARP
jgi:YihY family inner membrane protein